MAITETRTSLSSTYARPGGIASPWPGLPNLARLARRYNDANPTTIKVLGLGSSVMVGATLPDAATQSIVATLAASLESTLGIDVAFHNGGVNGTTIYDATGGAGDYADAKTAAGWTPDVVILGFGMNDGTALQYHAGQTLPGVSTYMRTLIRAIRADGADVIVTTTPHPHTERTTWGMGAVPVSYPTDSGASPVQVPDDTLGESIETGDWLGEGWTAPRSVRHARVNIAMASVAARFGAPVIDAERYWLRAVASLGEDALFNEGETVHPNLTGHQQSYHAAIEDFATALRHGAARIPDTSWSRRQVVVKAADETRTATTTAADDAELKLPVAPYDEVVFEIHAVTLSPTAADFKVGVSCPSGSTGKWWAVGLDTGASSIGGSAKMFAPTLLTDTTTLGGVGSRYPIEIRGHVNVGATGGVIAFQWAQGTSDAGDTRVYTDSFMVREVIN